MIEWSCGRNNYKKHSLVMNNETKIHQFNTELLDVPTRDFKTINELFADDLAERQTKTVEVLYSGGMDSECVLRSCLINKIPVRAVTGRFIARGYPVNTHDLYYSEKFCRENNIEQVFVDLDVSKFFENGDHLPYIKPYYIWQSHIATHFWLFEQCTGYPVFGGEYSWPWTTEKVVSPHRLIFSCYGRFLKDRNIHGIGNMLGHSLESNSMFITNHLEMMRQQPEGYYNGEFADITKFKRVLFNHMGFGDLEPRMKYYGWDNVATEVINIHKYTDELVNEYGWAESTITWHDTIAKAIDGQLGSNSRH